MNMEKIIGLLFIIVGLLLVIYPMVSSAFISIMIGFSMVCFGMSSICIGIIFTDIPRYKYLSIIIGLVSLIFGAIFMFFLNALPFLVSLQFFIIGFMMMFYGLMGMVFLDDKSYIALSAVAFILGILIVALAYFAASQTYLIAVIVGALLIVDGIVALVIGRSKSLIEKYG